MSISSLRETSRRENKRRQDDNGRHPLSKQLEDSVEHLTDEEKQYINDVWNS